MNNFGTFALCFVASTAIAALCVTSIVNVLY